MPVSRERWPSSGEGEMGEVRKLAASGEHYTVDQALSRAKQEDLEEVLVIGTLKGGEMFVVSNGNMTTERAAFLAYEAFLYAHGVEEQ